MLRKLSFGIILAAITIAGTQDAKAQAFEKGGTYLNLNLAGSHLYQIDARGDWSANHGWANSINGGVHVQMEWGIHQYVGLGFTAGLTGGRYGWGGWGPYGPGYGGGYGVLSVPVGFIANFHFYQLIEDKTTRDIHGDKLDIYAGLNIGSGIGVAPTPGHINALFFAGPQVGAKYYVTPTIGLGGEVGYGKSFINGGVTFKL